MQEDDKKTVDIDTSGPEVEVALPETQQEEKTPVEDKQTYEKKKDHGTDISYEMNVKQNLKTVVAPMTHLRNLYSSLMVRKIINKKITVNKLKSILKGLKSE